MRNSLLRSLQKACGYVLRSQLPVASRHGYRHSHNMAEATEVFVEEREHQLSPMKRFEKISAVCRDVAAHGDLQLQVNKHLSTPYTCTKHLGEQYTKQSALSMVDGQLWEMHRPLTEDCELNFLHFQQDDPSTVNLAFWRTCAFLLGSILHRAFKPASDLLLHRPLDLSVESGSFAYDFSANLGDWRPTETELRTLSQMGTRLSYGVPGRSNHYFIQPLDISVEKAKVIFAGSSYKLSQIEELAETVDTVTVYKMGQYVDLHNGPLIGNADLLGRFNVTAIHKIGQEEGRCVYRAQGVALPSSITMHSWTYKLLLQNAARLNESEEIKNEEIHHSKKLSASIS